MTALLPAIIARIESEASAIKTVDGAAAMAALRGKVRSSPSAYVVPAAERPEPIRMDAWGAQQHRLTITFEVYLALTGAGATGEGGIPDYEAARDALKAALIGWRHPHGETDTLYSGGRIITLDQGTQTLWSSFGFTFERTERFNQPTEE